MKKECSLCKGIKNFEEFAKDNRRPFNIGSWCYPCKRLKDKADRLKHIEKRRTYLKKWTSEHKELKSELDKEYCAKNREKIKEIKKLYQINNKEKYLAYQKAYRNKNPLNKAKAAIRSRISTILKNHNWKKSKILDQYLGCSASELRNYVKLKFTDGMSWENYGKWHLDHIIPLCKAKNEEELYKLSHYTNLQPLWAIDNLKKNKY